MHAKLGSWTVDGGALGRRSCSEYQQDTCFPHACCVWLPHTHASFSWRHASKVHPTPLDYSNMEFCLWPDWVKGASEPGRSLGETGPFLTQAEGSKDRVEKMDPRRERALVCFPKFQAIKSCKNFLLPLRATNSGHAKRCLTELLFK